jgi:hypothetical protein
VAIGFAKPLLKDYSRNVPDCQGELFVIFLRVGAIKGKAVDFRLPLI